MGGWVYVNVYVQVGCVGGVCVYVCVADAGFELTCNQKCFICQVFFKISKK